MGKVQKCLSINENFRLGDMLFHSYDVEFNFHKTLEPKSVKAELCHEVLLDFPEGFKI